MIITKVQYGKTYSLGNYCSERIDLEASIDETETVDEVVSALKKQCDNMHIKNNPERYEPKNYPHLYQEQTPITYGTPEQQRFAINAPLEIKNQEEKISAADEENNLITSIESSKNEQELIQYKLLAAKNNKTMGCYNNRKKQLNIQ